MKKLIALTLMLVMCLSLCACGEKNDESVQTDSPTEESKLTKEELLAESISVDAERLDDLVGANMASAKSLYCGRNLKVTSAEVIDIYQDYVSISFNHNTEYFCIRVYLSDVELVTLKDGDVISFVGESAQQFDTEFRPSVTRWNEWNYLDVYNAYLVTE